MKGLWLLLFLFLSPISASAAFTGFDTSGFATYHVTNTNLSGTGSLPDALSSGGRIIVFDIPNMVINGAGNSYHVLGNTLIDGSNGNSYPTLSGMELLIHSPTGMSGSETIENIKVIGVRFQNGKTYGDFVQIGYNAVNISVENCTFAAFADGDGSVDITLGSRDVDIKYNIFYGYYGPGASLAAFEVWGVRYHHNIFSNNYSRAPNIATFEPSSTVNPGITHPIADIRYNIYNEVKEGPTLVGTATANIAYNLINIEDYDYRHRAVMIWDVGLPYGSPIAKLYSAYIQGNISVNDCRVTSDGWNIAGVNGYNNHAEYTNLKIDGPTLSDKPGIIAEWQDAKDNAGFGTAYDNMAESAVRSAITIPSVAIFDLEWNAPSVGGGAVIGLTNNHATFKVGNLPVYLQIGNTAATIR